MEWTPQTAGRRPRETKERHAPTDVSVIREARKILKDYTWPILDHFTSARSYRLLFERTIADAMEEGVPESLIAKSIYNHFMKDRKTMLKFEHLATKYDFQKLSGIRKMIKHFIVKC